MKETVIANKAAWEEAFDKRSPDFGLTHAKQLQTERWPIVDKPMADAVHDMALRGGSVAHFCCNNGRELMSVVKNTGAREGVGFDIAGNILEQARAIAAETDIPCTFVKGDVCEAPATYENRFDLLLVTVGALCWMESLAPFFARVAACLKPGGQLLVHESHPVASMFAVPQEDAFDPADPAHIHYSYFRKEPFVDCYGMVYLTGGTYNSKPFTSFTHTLGEVVTAAAGSGLRIQRLTEYDTDLSGDAEPLDGKGIPLSYLLLAQKG